MFVKHNSLQRRLVLSAGLLSLAATLAAQTPDWKTYTFPLDGFSTSAPGEPTLTKQNVPTDAGSFELRAYSVQDGSAALFIGVCDYGAAAASRDPDVLLDGAQKGAIGNVNGHLISGKKITLDIYHGVEFEAESDTYHFSGRVYLVGTTLYQTLTAAPIAERYPGSRRFLDSFQLIALTQN